MKLIRNKELKKQYKRQLGILPIVILLVVAADYLAKENMMALLLIDVIIILILQYKNILALE